MDRSKALPILHEMTTGESLLRHARAVEIVMRHLAEIHQEDPEVWGAAGLLHDADYERWPEDHPKRIVARLRELGEDHIAHAISAHYTQWGVPYDTTLSRALLAADELTGFVVACSLVRPTKVVGLQPKSVLKKFKDKAFAAKVERAEIRNGCELLGVELHNMVQTVIDALTPHAEELGIS